MTFASRLAVHRIRQCISEIPPDNIASMIKGAFEALVTAFTAVARDAGHDAKSAKLRAERTIMLLQGSLVMSRGLSSSKPFKTFLSGLADDLIGTSNSNARSRR